MQKTSGEHQDIQLVKNINGRSFSSLNDNYVLPSIIDQDESLRLNRQGLAIKIAMDGLYFFPDVVERLLYPRNGESPRVLDAGCGTGMWAMDMARRFPHASVLGIDLSPPSFNPEIDPPNVRFQTYDINNGMSQFRDQFDMIQMRCVGSGIRDIYKTFEELVRSLKPGGFITIIDGDHLLTEDRTKYVNMMEMEGDDASSMSVSKEGSWFQRLKFEMLSAGEISGVGIKPLHELMDYGIWDQELCDPATVRAGSLYFPVGTWANDPNPSKTRKLQVAGALTQLSHLNVHLAWHTFLLRHGMGKETLQEWSRKIEHELHNQRAWMRLGFCCARRRSGKDLPATSLPNIPGFSLLPSALIGHPMLSGLAQDQDGVGAPYPAVDLYSTRNQAIEGLRRRRDLFVIPNTSVVGEIWKRKQRMEAKTRG
ncbi:S-adenosyl-L-methionine-dependent methyltransferase [Serendipita vermifera]|nr:S-adenosyl-L-methionine-dependent methyltransferase [Serendipita vermifera]